MKRYAAALLLAGAGLIVGSCVPLVQGLGSGLGADPVLRVNTPPQGGRAPLSLGESRAVVPVIGIQGLAAAADTGTQRLEYAFSIADAAGGELVRDTGTAVFDRGVGSALRLAEIAIPAGRWTLRLETGAGADLVQGIEIRLLPAGAGPFAMLLTALVVAILGWLTASLGALQWIRAEAARPGAEGGAGGGAGEARLWTVGCHLSALSGYLLPFGHLVGPLAVWLARRHVFPEVESAGREVLNFQLSVTLYVLVGLILSFFLIGLVVLFVLAVFHFSMVLHASLRAQRGQAVHYPLSMRFI